MSRQKQASFVNIAINKYQQIQDDGSIAVINAESYSTSRKVEGENTTVAHYPDVTDFIKISPNE